MQNGTLPVCNNSNRSVPQNVQKYIRDNLRNLRENFPGSRSDAARLAVQPVSNLVKVRNLDRVRRERPPRRRKLPLVGAEAFAVPAEAVTAEEHLPAGGGRSSGHFGESFHLAGDYFHRLGRKFSPFRRTLPPRGAIPFAREVWVFTVFRHIPAGDGGAEAKNITRIATEKKGWRHREKSSTDRSSLSGLPLT